MKAINQYLEETLLFSKDDLYYKFDDWKSGKNKVLLVTGYSGSGKTTLGKKLAKKYNVKYNEFDTNVRVTAAFDKTKEELEKKYPKDIAHKKLHKLIHTYVINTLNKVTKQSVWEGCFMLTWLTPEEFSKYSVIITGASITRSTIRDAKRRIDANKKYPDYYFPWSKSAYITTKFNVNELMKYYNKLWKYLKAKQ